MTDISEPIIDDLDGAIKTVEDALHDQIFKTAYPNAAMADHLETAFHRLVKYAKVGHEVDHRGTLVPASNLAPRYMRASQHAECEHCLQPYVRHPRSLLYLDANALCDGTHVRP